MFFCALSVAIIRLRMELKDTLKSSWVSAIMFSKYFFQCQPKLQIPTRLLVNTRFVHAVCCAWASCATFFLGSKARRDCPICLKTFASPSSLYEHKLTHEGLTNCPICGKFLSRLSNLRRHMESQHQIPKDQMDAILGSRRWWTVSFGVWWCICITSYACHSVAL